MEFNFMPTLTHMTCVKIATYLLEDRDISELLDKDTVIPYQFNFFDRCRYELWKLIEQQAMLKLSFLPTPLSLKVAKTIQPMHFQIMMWLMDHDLMPRRKGFCINYRRILCWKINGTIDRKETAKRYVQNRSIDSRDRFIMACNYFMIDDILCLWGVIQAVGVKSTSKRGVNSAVRLWMDALKDGKTTPTGHMIEEYFSVECLRDSDIPLRLSPYFRYLKPMCRQDYLHILAFGQLHKDDFQMCMCQMDEKECAKLFKIIPAEALTRYLEWPFQFLFMEMVTKISSNLSPQDYVKILDYIVKFVILNGDIYAEIFKEFWSIIPDSQKERIKGARKYKAYEVILDYKKNQLPSLQEEVAKYYFI
ncbi:uncharacterized protein LOC129981910 [Argiope bruennichi]|uniref:Uncharacterized protein n=1 Tax=Argiope bruennichi TaxID=94029 RepID=A0A8T0G4Y6_ARGBR|nr:uncharacterized protein LOC129981910 [Argiope bruennichi]XP_055948937.1 uncharacterized protein LOC129981910 [Argiope bruennichi]XP_055948938.1 uncharacterized protein LOC129981910 [Argiope bruennichi]XP_055948939.1 uncharacterized protein LOC129981910 [Argiope bruennichi]KAF8796929.1 hypothetical protein HNY73_001257 [Argiope bruennichi]